MTCGEKIQKLRKEKNYTQEDLADICNVSRQSVSRWESDIAFPETDKIILLSKLFKCSIDYLLNPENDNKDLVSAKSRNGFAGKARLPLAIVTICVMLLTIGLFFCNWFEVVFKLSSPSLYGQQVTGKFNFYQLAFYDLKIKDGYENVLALFAFILVVSNIILSVLYIIFDSKQIAYSITSINAFIPVLVLTNFFNGAISYGIGIPVLVVLTGLVVCQFAIKPMNEVTILKVSPLAISTIYVVIISILCMGFYMVDIKSTHKWTYFYIVFFGYGRLPALKSASGLLYALTLIAALTLSILLIVKKDKRFIKFINILNVVTLVTYVASLNDAKSVVEPYLVSIYILFFLAQVFFKDMSNEGAIKRSPLVFMSILGAAIVAFLFTSHGWFKYEDTLDHLALTDFVQVATFANKDVINGAYSVFAAIGYASVILSMIVPMIYAFIDNKYLKLSVCILNSLAPIMIVLSLIFANHPYYPGAATGVLIIYTAINACQYVIKQLRPFPLKEVSETVA